MKMVTVVFQNNIAYSYTRQHNVTFLKIVFLILTAGWNWFLITECEAGQLQPTGGPLLWPARATTKISPAAPLQPLADPIGWGFRRGVGEQRGLLSATARYCNLLQRKWTRKHITLHTLLQKKSEI